MNIDDHEWEPPCEADMKLIAKRRERSDRISKLMSGYLLKGYKMLGSVCDKCDTILIQDRHGTNYCVACSELDSDTEKDDPAINESAAISMVKEHERGSVTASLYSTNVHHTSGVSLPIQASATNDVAIQQSTSLTPTLPSSRVSCSQEQSTSDSRAKKIRDDVAGILSISSIDVQSFTSNVLSGTRGHLGPTYACSTMPKPMIEEGINLAQGNSEKSSVRTTMGARGDSLFADSNTVHVSRLQDKINWASEQLCNNLSVEYSVQLCQLIKIAAEAIMAVRNARM